MLHRAAASQQGAAARCQRCGALLYRNRKNGIERTLALTIAGIILFIVANTLPFLSFEMNGRITQTTLISGVAELYAQGYFGLAALVLLTAVLAPGVQLGLLAYTLLPLHLGQLPWHLSTAFRTLRQIQPWSMMEVFLIGIFVALVKLSETADIVTGLALWALALLIGVIAATASTLDAREVWKHVELEP